MDSRIEKLLNRQIELVDRLQDRADEILDWRTSPDNAEAVLGYFDALECAVESLGGLSELYKESKNWNLEDQERRSDRNKDDEDRNDYRVTSRDKPGTAYAKGERDDGRDEYQDRRRL